MGTKTLASLQKNKDFWPKNGQIWPKTGILGQISAFLPHLILWPTKKRCEQGAYVVFMLSGYQDIYLLPFKLGFKAQKRPNLVPLLSYNVFRPKILIFMGVSKSFGTNITETT